MHFPDKAGMALLHRRHILFSVLLALGGGLVLSFQNCSQNYQLSTYQAKPDAQDQAWFFYTGSASTFFFSPSSGAVAANTVLHFTIADTIGGPAATAAFSPASWDVTTTSRSKIISNPIHVLDATYADGSKTFYFNMNSDDGAISQTLPVAVINGSARPTLTLTTPSPVIAGQTGKVTVTFSSVTVARLQLSVALTETPSGTDQDWAQSSFTYDVPIGSSSVDIPLASISGAAGRPDRTYSLVVTEVIDNTGAASTATTSITVKN